jgi:lauroyl/myristoyl acyltransferase
MTRVDFLLASRSRTKSCLRCPTRVPPRAASVLRYNPNFAHENRMTSASDRPLFTLADLSGLAYAYPLCGIARRFPESTIWAMRTLAAPFYRRMRRSDRIRMAEVMRRWLGIPPRDAEELAGRWIGHALRHASEDLAMLAGREIECRLEIAGQKRLDDALTGDRGVLLVSMHFFAGVPAKRRLRRMGYSILSIHRPYIPGSAGRLGLRRVIPRIDRLREKMRIGEVIPAGDTGSALRIADLLRHGGIAEMAADIESKTSAIVPFLNGRTAVSTGVLELARLCRCPVLPLTATYVPDGLRLEIGEPLAGLDRPALVREMERQVLACPEQWQRWIDLH